VTERKFRIGVLGSGKGSNLVALAEACAAKRIRGEVAPALTAAVAAGMRRQKN